MSIDPRIVFWFGVWTSILLGLATGAVNLPNTFSHEVAAAVTSWAAFLGWINTMILTAATGYSSNKPGPMVGAPPSTTSTVVKVLLVAFALSFLVAATPAMAQTPLRKPAVTGNLVNDIKADMAEKRGPGLTGAPVTDLQNFFNAKLLPDLQYSLKLATAAKNDITAVCYQSWIDIINTQQAAVKNADGTDIAMPDPHIITEFEKLVELRNALQPESPFMRSCSPVASMVKKDIAGFIGMVISGGAGLATLVPGL